jgi:hypothetical protein
MASAGLNCASFSGCLQAQHLDARRSTSSVPRSSGSCAAVEQHGFSGCAPWSCSAAQASGWVACTQASRSGGKCTLPHNAPTPANGQQGVLDILFIGVPHQTVAADHPHSVLVITNGLNLVLDSPSPLQHFAAHLRGITRQCPGTSPSHSTPDDFMGASGFSLGSLHVK